MAFGTMALQQAKTFGSALKRSQESRDCIDSKKAQGKSGRQARKELSLIHI